MNFDKKINPQIYLKNPFEVATEYLLGAYLCSVTDGKLTIGKTTEVEVYIGAEDKASHAYKNKLTKRTATMFKKGGCAYVFFVYGMYNQFNVVVSEEGNPNAILIRALEPIDGIEFMQERRNCPNLKNLTTGPGKLCQAMGITKSEHDGINLCSDKIWISPKTQNYEYVSDKRVSIDYAQEYKDKLWRFYIKNSNFISVK